MILVSTATITMFAIITDPKIKDSAFNALTKGLNNADTELNPIFVNIEEVVFA